jgi:hypothetical protein
VRYTTERELVEKEKTHWLRPRLDDGYSAVLAIMFALFAWTLVARVPLQIEADLATVISCIGLALMDRRSRMFTC